MKSLYPVFFILFLLSCSLSADQERSLNKAHVDYAWARNSGDVIKFTAFTHPKVVSHYKQLGDSLFQLKFNLPVDIEHIQDGSVVEIEKENGAIHARVDFTLVNIGDFDRGRDKKAVIAISIDEGETWFMVESEDYYNDAIFAVEDRLIKKE